MDKKQWFFSDDFQIKWNKYLNAFGKDLDMLFGDDYDKKIRFALGLEHLLNSKFNDAYHEIRHFESACTTESDKQIFSKFLALCFNEEEMAKAKDGDWVKKSGGGYYKIIKRTSVYAIIKNTFDSELVYIKESRKADWFKIITTDLKTYQFPQQDELTHIQTFFLNHPEKGTEFLRYTDKMLSFKEAILNAGFKEAHYDFKQFHFYRYTTDKVAFILNLKDLGDCIQIVYGFTSIAEEDFLKNNGEDDSNIKLRFRADVAAENDEKAAAIAIRNTYNTYCTCSKDEILSLKKDRQKQFLQSLTEKLKPLGFKKKGANWTKVLVDGFCLEFEAQKSQWSDEYYFNVSVYHKDNPFPPCFGTRLNTNGRGSYNWQIMREEETDRLLNEAIKNILLPIINTPLTDLGNEAEIWKGCICPRNKCNICWVKKNLWEAKESE